MSKHCWQGSSSLWQTTKVCMRIVTRRVETGELGTGLSSAARFPRECGKRTGRGHFSPNYRNRPRFYLCVTGWHVLIYTEKVLSGFWAVLVYTGRQILAQIYECKSGELPTRQLTPYLIYYKPQTLNALLRQLENDNHKRAIQVNSRK